jgi:hypothetical protein
LVGLAIKSYKAFQPVSIAPLITFRIAFGLVMLFSTARYMYLGWIDTQLVDPILHFHYFGFEWIRPLSRTGMYLVFYFLMFASLGIAIGLYYRISTILFFLLFTYVELIDITYYLNHYYFVSVVALIMIFLPANKKYAVDVLRVPALQQDQVSRWCIDILKLQIAVVYVYAGIFKINGDWLTKALPLSIWLPAKTSLPIIGSLFKYPLTAYVFSWAGMLFDTFIVAALLIKRTRIIAYLAVVVFHTMTGILFQIGIFPLVMMLVVTIFFPASYHEKALSYLNRFLPKFNRQPLASREKSTGQKWLFSLFALFMVFQLLFPWRYLLYPGNIFWTEEGYRFSWRVMLMEKAGTATFYVKDTANGREGAVINRQFLNEHQEKQMSMQPDLILQFAHYLEEYYKKQGLKDPEVRAEVLVTFNARPARLLIDPQQDLTQIKDGWSHKSWIIPFKTYFKE